MMTRLILSGLFAAAPAAAGPMDLPDLRLSDVEKQEAPAPACGETLSEYLEEWVLPQAVLRGKELVELERDGGGRWTAPEGLAAAFARHTAAGADAARVAAEELALYLDRFELPAGLRLQAALTDATEPYRKGSGRPVISHSGFAVPDSDGAGWFQAIDDPNLLNIRLVVSDGTGCHLGDLELRRYVMPRDGAAPSLARIDAAEGTPIDLIHLGCGSLYSHRASVGIDPLDKALEDRLVRDDYPQTGVGRSDPAARDKFGLPTQSEGAALFPGRDSARLVLDKEKQSASFELPKYLPGRLVPSRIVVHCRKKERIDVRYIRGDRLRVFENIPIERR